MWKLKLLVIKFFDFFYFKKKTSRLKGPLLKIFFKLQLQYIFNLFLSFCFQDDDEMRSGLHTGSKSRGECVWDVFWKFWIVGSWCRKRFQWVHPFLFYCIIVIKFFENCLWRVLFHTSLPPNTPCVHHWLWSDA